MELLIELIKTMLFVALLFGVPVAVFSIAAPVMERHEKKKRDEARRAWVEKYGESGRR